MLQLKIVFFLSALTETFKGLRRMVGKNGAKAVIQVASRDFGRYLPEYISTSFDIEWDAEKYKDIYVGKFLEGLGARPELVEIGPKRIVLRQHTCPIMKFATEEDLLCTFCEKYEGRVLQEILEKDFKTRLTSRYIDEKKYCEFVAER